MYHILTGYFDGGCSRPNLLNDRKAAFKTVCKTEGRGCPFIGAGYAIQPSQLPMNCGFQGAVKSSSSIACLMDVVQVQQKQDSWFI